MPVPTSINDLSVTASSNSPAGGDSVGASLDEYLRIIQAMLKEAVATLYTVSGTDTLTFNTTPSFSSYSTGQRFFVKSAGANTGAVTLNINGIGAKNVLKSGGTALSAGDISGAGLVFAVVYDGTQFQAVGLSASDLARTGTANTWSASQTLGTGTSLIFEGATNDAFETTLSATDPTADRAVTLPDQSGVVALLENIQAQAGIAYTTGGTSTAYTLTPTPALTALAENQEFDVEFHTAAGTTPTLAISGLTAKSLKYRDSSGTLTAVTSTQIPSGWRSRVTYDGTDYIVREIPSVSSGITLGTAATASSTAVEFTGLPAGVKRITLSYALLSTSGSSPVTVQLGDSGGYETTGYSGTASNPGGTASAMSSGFLLRASTGGASEVYNGAIILTLMDSTNNTWSGIAVNGLSNAANLMLSAGSKSLSATLDRIRITTSGGSDTFDAGTINIAYE